MVKLLALAAGPEVLRTLYDAPMVIILRARIAVRTKVAYNDATELAWGAEKAPDEIHGVCLSLIHI